MVLGSYTLFDLLTSLLSVILFVPVLLAPGYVLAWALNLLGFRNLEARWRFLVSIPVSIAFSPIAIYWLGRLFAWAAVSIAFTFFFLAWLALLAGFFGHEPPREWLRSLRTVPRFAWIVGGVWLVVALASLVDLQIGDRLYFSVVTNDYAVRTAVTDAINHEGVLPSNPFYRITGPVPLRYHYFWFLPCSFVARLSGLSDGSRPAMNASVVWCGWGLLALVPMYLRFLQGLSGATLSLRSKLAIGFFTVTGLDIIPALLGWVRHSVKADLEWWNNAGQITSWVGSLLWVPHNTAALVAGLTGFLLLWHAGLQRSLFHRIAVGLTAGCTLASMVGCSVYVAIVFAAFLAVWSLFLLLKGHFDSVVPLLAAGAITVLLATPYLLSLVGQGGGKSFLSFSVRHFVPLETIANHFHVSHRGLIGLRLVFLPLEYFLELGFFFVVPFVYLRRLWKRRNFALHEIALFLLAAVPAFIATFLRSSVVQSNDLGWRGFLPVQFVLLLWSAELFTGMRDGANAQEKRAVSLSSWKGAAWACLLLLGISGTIYELGILRFHGVLADAGICSPFFTRDRRLGKLTFAIRQGYEQMGKILPANAVILGNPKWDVYDFFLGLYAHRATAAFDQTCGSQYGGNEEACRRMYPAIKSAFVEPIPYNAGDVKRLGQSLHVSALVVYDLDDAWKSSAWPLQMQPAIQNNGMRVYLINQYQQASN